MKTYKLLCLFLASLLILCGCGAGETSQSESTSAPEESVAEKAPVRYTYAEEVTAYDVSEAFQASYNGLYYIGNDTIIFSKKQTFGSLDTPVMVMYDLTTGEYGQSYLPKDDLEQICTRFLGVRENGEFGLASGYGESIWFDKDGKYLGFDLWFDTDKISPAYHALIEAQKGFMDNGENLLIYYDAEKSIPDSKEYYTLFDRATGKKLEFLTWDDAINDNYESYTVLGFVGKDRLLYQKHVQSYEDGYHHVYTMHLHDLNTGKETVIETGDDPDDSFGGMLYLRETEGGCLFAIRDRRWLKTMFLSEDGTVTQVGESYTLFPSDGEIYKLAFDRATKTFAVMTEDKEHSGELRITLLDADTLTPYAETGITLEQDFIPAYLDICHDGTVHIFARKGSQGTLYLWKTK